MRCLQWPLRANYKIVNFDQPLLAGLNTVHFGPPGSRAGDLAWVIFNLAVSYSTPVYAGGFIVPFYQQNQSTKDRSTDRRVTLTKFPTDAVLVFHIIGGCTTLENPASTLPPFYGQQRPLYVPFPDEISINITNVPVGGRQGTLRGLVLEVPQDTDVSALL